MVPDYYARLGIESGTDRVEIEAALRRKQPIWSLGTRNPKTRHTNQLYLDEIPALRRALLGDSSARQAYDTELASSKWIDRQRKLDELERGVRLRSARGVLDGSDRKMLLDEADRLGLEPESLAPLIQTIPTLDDDTVDIAPVVPDPSAETLEPATRRQIRVALELLGRRDLYDALGVTRDAPDGEVADRADAERRRWMNKAQVTAEKTAWLEVISHAQSHLGTSKNRARYDRTLELDAEDAFDTLIDFAVKRRKELDLATYKALIDEAARLGVKRSRAEKVIARKCRQLDFAVPQTGPPSAMLSPNRLGDSGIVRSLDGDLSPVGAGVQASPPESLRCRECSGLTDVVQPVRKGKDGAGGPAGPPTCRHCGASLEWECPVCRKTHRIDKRRCSCGFRIEHQEPLIRHFASAQHAFRINDLDLALKELRRVQEYAPTHVGARSGIAKVQERRAEIEQARLVYERAKAGGNLVAALSAIEAWKKLAPAASLDVQAAWEETSEGLKQAELLVAQARGLLRKDPAAARSLYRQSLDIAADLPEALAGLSRTPPDPPTQLQAQIHGDRITLRWKPPAPDGEGPLTFVVVRKQGGALSHPGDGSRIAEVSEPELDDTPPIPGETVGYAVLTRRGGVDSVTAVTLTPFPFLANVKDARAERIGSEVSLSWSPLTGASEVRVVRKPGTPPQNVKDGERIATSLDRAEDKVADDGQVYYYGIYAAYRQPDGRLYPSPGVVLSV